MRAPSEPPANRLRYSYNPTKSEPDMCIPSKILAVAVALGCGVAAAQTPAPSSTPTPASQSTPTPASTPTPTNASTPNPTPANNPTPTNAQNPNTQQNPQTRFPATRQNTTVAPGAQQNAATRCAALTGIPKAECERRDAPDASLPAGKTQAQAEREAKRAAEAAAANRNPRPRDTNRSTSETQTPTPRE
jgi:hypothetical protein